MTSDEIDKMEAGRDMDGLIAECVFGWVWRERGNYPRNPLKVLHPPDNDPEGWKPCNYSPDLFRPAADTTLKFTDWDMSCVRHDINGRPQFGIPAFSTDPGATWKVVEKMRESDCDLSISSAGAMWSVQHALVNGYTLAPTMPLAVCRAALKWAISTSPGRT